MFMHNTPIRIGPGRFNPRRAARLSHRGKKPSYYRKGGTPKRLLPKQFPEFERWEARRKAGAA